MQPRPQRLHSQWVARCGDEGALAQHFEPGCPRSDGAELVGRVGVHELRVADHQIRRMVQARAPAAERAGSTRQMSVETDQHNCPDGVSEFVRVMTARGAS
jgi:type II secretory ATPase GspE/PulE/Tfp pilus assembly ATPase PilB-like protein